MKILSFGSLNLDYVYSLDHFVRGGETIASLKREEFCGGKGLNQSIALARAGAEVYHGGRVGAEGEVLKNRLRESGVDVSLTETLGNVPTGHAIIQVDKTGQNCIIIYGGANQSMTESDVDAMLKGFGEGDIILLQNETSMRDYAITKAAEKGMQVALNPSPIDEGLINSPALKYVKYFILNEIEGHELSSESEPERICEEMHKRFPGSVVVLTLGKDGVMYSDGENVYTHGIYKVKAVDTTAAGDTFAGYFLACSSKGVSPEKAIAIASKASGIAVSRAGASDSIPTMAEVESLDIPLA